MHTYRRGINGKEDEGLDRKEAILYTEDGFNYCMWGRQIISLGEERFHHFGLAAIRLDAEKEAAAADDELE